MKKAKVLRKESICTIPVHVPPMAGSVHLTSALLVHRRTRLMAEALPLRKTCYFCFSFHLTSISCLWISLVYKDHDGLCDVTEEQRHVEKWREWSDQIPDMVTLPWPSIIREIFCWCIISGHWTHTDWKSCSGCCFSFFISHFYQAGLLHLPVYTCQTWKKKKDVFKCARECSPKP